MLRAIIAGAGLLALALTVSVPAMAQEAVPMFVDDFTEAGATPGVGIKNFTELTHWEITRGSVDLFNADGFGLTCASEGCLDLDGSGSIASRLESRTAFEFKSGQSYDVVFAFQGKYSDTPEKVVLGITDGPSKTVSRGSNKKTAFTETLNFTADSDFAATIYIDHAGGDSNGLFLDSVTLTEAEAAAPQIILPAAVAAVVAGLGAIFVVYRRRG